MDSIKNLDDMLALGINAVALKLKTVLKQNEVLKDKIATCINYQIYI